VKCCSINSVKGLSSKAGGLTFLGGVFAATVASGLLVVSVTLVSSVINLRIIIDKKCFGGGRE
jgi:hypothetical protein